MGGAYAGGAMGTPKDGAAQNGAPAGAHIGGHAGAQAGMQGMAGTQQGVQFTQASVGPHARYGTVKIGEQHVGAPQQGVPGNPPPPICGQQPVQVMLPKHTGLNALYGLQQI
jgi:hypothetical protein